MVDGEAHYSFEEANYRIGKGQLLFFKASSPHKVHVAPESAYGRVVIHFTREFFTFEHDILTAFYRLLEDQRAGPHLLLNLHPLAEREFHGIIEKLLQENDESDVWGHRGALQIHLLEALLFLCRECDRMQAAVQTMPGCVSNKHEIIEKVLQELDAVWDTGWSLDQIARRMHLNKFYLSHLFKREIGMTIQQYMLQRRCNEARKLLANSDLPVKEIAQRVGFVSDSNFIRSFKQQLKLTPNHYRKIASEHRFKL